MISTSSLLARKEDVTNYLGGQEMSDTNPTTSATLDTVASTGEWKLRLYHDGDIPAIVALMNAAYEVDGFGATTEQELAASYLQPLSDPQRQVILAEGPTGELLGVSRAICFDDPGANERLYQMRVVLRPTARSKESERDIASQMIENIRSNEQQPGMQPRAKVSLIGITREEDKSGRALLEQIGLRDIRHAWTMQRPLDLPIGEPNEITDVAIRPYRRPEDNTALLDAYNNSFIDHFEFHALTQEIIDYQVGRPAMRPDLSWVGEIEAEPSKLAGFCICEINEQDNARSGNQEGWIALLGTVRGWRGIGLGKSLLLSGIRSLKAAGMETALLGVDSESPTGANRLYESVGFTVRHHEILYKCELREAKL
jgi:mycothiol synthase